MLNLVSVSSGTETVPADLVLWFEKSHAADLELTFTEFCEIVAGSLDRLVFGSHTPAERESAIENIRWDELLLARACSRGSQTAWDRFLMLYRQRLHAAALAIAREESVAHELADSLYADLFGTRTRADGSRISKLESYSGRGSLEGWLKTVLVQMYVDRFREQKRLFPLQDGIDLALPDQPATCSLGEIALVTEVTDAVLEKLASEERFLLAAYYLDGETFAEIGRIIKMHESSVKRRIDKTLAGLRKAIVSGLCKAGIEKSKAREMLSVDVRDLTLDIRARLAQQR